MLPDAKAKASAVMAQVLRKNPANQSKMMIIGQKQAPEDRQATEDVLDNDAIRGAKKSFCRNLRDEQEQQDNKLYKR